MRRPNPAPLTAADMLIWFAIDRHDIFRIARESDRRDADLMLLAQQVSSCGPCAVELHGIACRGWSQGTLSPERFAQAWVGALDT